LDAVAAEQLGGLRWLWLVLHQEGRLEPFPGATWLVVYPLVPWVAVMAAGYAIGPWALLPRAERRERFFVAGAMLVVGFVVLRAANLYRDPHPWTAGGGGLPPAPSFP